MSLNTAHANGGVLIFNGEVILLYCDGMELHVEGSDAKDFAGNKKGRIYLTSHRMIFVNKSEKDRLQSFSFPFFSMTSIELEQPIFGANYIKGTVAAQAGGNWAGRADFKLKFNTGGAIEFGQAMLQAAKMASRYMPPQPPPYIPSQGPYYPAQPPAYMPPSNGLHGFVPPTHVFPNAPPANSVYTSDMPPPYPGIYPPPYANPSGAQGYPQVPPGYNPGNTAGASGYAGGPPPVGFNTGMGGAPPNTPQYNGGPPNAPQYNGAPPNVLQYNGAPPNVLQYNGAPPNVPQYNGAPMQGQHDYSGDAKAMEAIHSAYQDPYNPSNLYLQQNPYGASPNYQGPPPPYFEAQKKDQ